MFGRPKFNHTHTQILGVLNPNGCFKIVYKSKKKRVAHQPVKRFFFAPSVLEKNGRFFTLSTTKIDFLYA